MTPLPSGPEQGDADVSISAARLVWLAMREAVFSDAQTDFAPDYFFGFSHACMLCLVISPTEWEVVKNRVGDMRAHQICRQQTAVYLGAEASPSDHKG